MTKDEALAMDLALEALESYHGYMEPLTTVFGGPRVPAEQSTTGKVEKAITALRTAIEQAEKQEPHSWYSAEHDEWMTDKTRKEHERLNSYTHKVGGFDLPLYTTPPAAPVQEPVAFNAGVPPLYPEMKDGETISVEYTTPPGGRQSEDCLTAAQKDIQRLSALVRAQKITIDKLEQDRSAPVQEPSILFDGKPPIEFVLQELFAFQQATGCDTADQVPPAAQRQWVGLTNKEIYYCEPKTDWYDSVEFARAIEAKLKEKNGGQA